MPSHCKQAAVSFWIDEPLNTILFFVAAPAAGCHLGW
jgi:hypothetical protein